MKMMKLPIHLLVSSLYEGGWVGGNQKLMISNRNLGNWVLENVRKYEEIRSKVNVFGLIVVGRGRILKMLFFPLFELNNHLEP